MVKGDGAWCVELQASARSYRVCLNVVAPWKNMQNLWCENVSICLNFSFPQAVFHVKILPANCSMDCVVKAPQTVAQVVLPLQHLIYRYWITKNNSNTSHQIVYPFCLYLGSHCKSNGRIFQIRSNSAYLSDRTVLIIMQILIALIILASLISL